jgi:hypothetical protein
MTRSILQEIKLSVPLLVVPAGDKTPECDDIIARLCASAFTIDFQNSSLLTDLCKSQSLTLPTNLHVHPIFCPTVPALVQAADRLRGDQYHAFTRSYQVIVFIDYSYNEDVVSMRAEFLRVAALSEADVILVVINATEALSYLPPDRTCLCFKRETAMSFIQEFLACNLSTCLSRVVPADSGPAKDRIATVRQMKVRSDLCSICCGLKDAAKWIKKALGELEAKDAPDWIATCFETLGMLEDRERGVARGLKLIPATAPPPSFVGVTAAASDAGGCYLHAAGYYNKGGSLEKCVDAGIRMVTSGERSIVNAIVSYIIANGEPLKQKAWDLFYLVSKLGMTRKAALIASQFAAAFKSDRPAFRIHALDLILQESSSAGLVQLRDLSIPMLQRLLKKPQVVPNFVLARFLSKILSAIGPDLPKEQEEVLFSQLAIVTTSEIELPLQIQKVEVKRPQYDIIKRHVSSQKTVFLYSYLQDKRQNTELSVPLAQTVTVTAQLYNPYRIPLQLDCVKLIVNNDSVICKSSFERLGPLATNTVHLHLVPTQITPLSVYGIEVTMFGAKQQIRMKDEIQVTVVDNVPRYHLRTDLPLSSDLALYDGEIHEFRFWVTNAGDSTITQLRIDFQQPEIARLVTEPRLPLLPGGQLSIRCSLTADKNEDIIAMTIISSCAGSDFSCSQQVRQILSISDSLSVRRIFPLRIAPPQPESDDTWVARRCDGVYVGYEVENLSDCTFQYDATVSDTRTMGLIGSHESLLMVASYATTELKSDGSDAQKSRVIAMTKTMEEILRRGLNPDERVKVAKGVSIVQKLEAKWKFDWAVSATRKGKLVRRAAVIDDDLFQAIESRQILAKISWREGEAAVDQIVENRVYEMVADFESDVVVACELQFVGEPEVGRTIFWEGELDQKIKEGATEFAFLLCFSEPGKFRMLVKHVAKSGITGQTPVMVIVRAES